MNLKSLRYKLAKLLWPELDANDGIYKRDDKGRIESLSQVFDDFDSDALHEAMKPTPKPKRKYTKKTKQEPKCHKKKSKR